MSCVFISLDQVDREAIEAYSKANRTRDAVHDALETVNDLLGLLGKRLK